MDCGSWQGRNHIRNHYNAVTVQTVETAAHGRRLVIEARAYDDGVAFRYVVPEQPNLKELRILNESTQFNFTKDAVIWPLILRGFQTSSEGDYPEMPMANLRPDNLVYLPLLLHLPGVAWVGLTEADIDDYPSLFVTSAGIRSLAARLSPRVEDVNTSADTAPAFDPAKDASSRFGDRATAREIGLARADDRRRSRTPGGIGNGAQFESALRHR